MSEPNVFDLTDARQRMTEAMASKPADETPDIEMWMDDDRITFRDQEVLDDYVRGAVVEAIRKAADDFQRKWPIYGDDWLRDRADAIASGWPIAPLVEQVCTCGHLAIDHHGSDPDDGCLGVASHRLPPCPCRLTCPQVADPRATAREDGGDRG